MTKKDFELIACVIRGYRDLITADQRSADQMADLFAIALRNTNPRFDRDRFIAACEKDAA